jgi:hypothetical protein
VGLEYASGLEAIAEPKPFSGSSSVLFRRVASELGLPDGFRRVAGSPALVIPDGWHGAERASVELVRNGVAVTLYGNVPTNALMQAASTIR